LGHEGASWPKRVAPVSCRRSELPPWAVPVSSFLEPYCAEVLDGVADADRDAAFDAV